MSETKYITQNQEDKLYNYILDRMCEVHQDVVRELLQSGCKGYDNYTTAELVEEIEEYMSHEDDMSDLPDDIRSIVKEYQANEEIHKTLTEVNNDNT